MRFLNAKTTFIAAGDVLGQIPDSRIDWAKTNGLAGPVPEWVKRVYPSHRELKFVGGLIACMKCGSISSSGVGNSNQWKVCSTKIAEGSKGRLQEVFAGAHPQFGPEKHRSWPDGRPATERIRMQTYLRAVDIPIQRAVVQPQRFFDF